MKRKMLVALSVALALALAPVGGHLMTAAAAELNVVSFERENYASVSGNEAGSVSDNDGGTVSDNNPGSVSDNDVPNEGDGISDNKQDKESTSNNQNAGEAVTTGPSVTVTDSAGKQIVTTVPINNTSSEVQSIAVVTPKNEINESAGLTEQQLKDGQYVVVVTSDSQCGENAKKAIHEAAMSVGAKVATILEIDLAIFNQSGMQIGKVTDLSKPIRFTISVPANIAEPEKYDFALVRIHNGETGILPDLDNDPATITVETDGFSVYAVAYGEAGSFDGFRTAGVKDSVPKTGSVFPLVFPAAAVGILLAVSAVVIWKKKKEL